MSKTVSPCGKSSPSSLRRLQDLEEHRRAHVLAQRLLQLQFLRPFHVVADVGHVDARPRDLQLVEDLDGLQLDDARAAQPGEHDVLRQLAVRSGRRAERRGSAVAVERDREIQPRDAAEELGSSAGRRSCLPSRTRERRAARAEAAEPEPAQPWRRSHRGRRKSAETPRRTAPPPPGAGSARARSRCAPLPLRRGRTRWWARPSAPWSRRRWC